MNFCDNDSLEMISLVISYVPGATPSVSVVRSALAAASSTASDLISLGSGAPSSSCRLDMCFAPLLVSGAMPSVFVTSSGFVSEAASGIDITAGQ